MNIYLSWAGSQSEKVARQLKDIFCDIFYTKIEVFNSPDDIPLGKNALYVKSKALNKTSFGVFCFDKGNLNNTWMLFELGAISKGDMKDTTVIPLLIDLSKEELQDPIRMFTPMSYTKIGLKKLVLLINESLNNDKMERTFLERRFETEWKTNFQT